MGDEHLHELHEAGVNTALVVRGQWPTSLSAIFVKPDGSRTLVNYGGGHDLPIRAEFHHRLSLPSARISGHIGTLCPRPDHRLSLPSAS